MGYFGDIRLGDTIDIKFTTVNTSAVPTTLAGSPVISAYPGNSTTELTAGITLTVDFDSRTGLNNVRVAATSGNGYGTATNYALIITTGTIGGTSAVGYEVGSFSIENRSALMPTTAGRTATVAATGEVTADATKIASDSTAATNLKTAFNDTAGSVPWNGIIDQGTAQSVSGTTIQFRSAAAFADNELNGATVTITGGSTGVGQSRTILSYVGATDTATVDTWTTTPTGTITYKIWAVAPQLTTPQVDVIKWNGTAVLTPDTAGAPKVTVKSGTGTGEVSLSSGLVRLSAAGVDDVWDEATSGHLVAGTFGQWSQLIRANTAQAGAAGSITLDVGSSASDDFYKNQIIQIISGTGANQARTISAYTGSTKVATVTPNWVTNPDATSVFVIRPAGSVAGATAPTAADVADAVWDEARAGHLTAGTYGEGVQSVQGNVTGSVASVTGNVGGNVSGNVTGSVGSVAAGGITAASLAADAITAAKVAADVGTEFAAALLAATVEGSTTVVQSLRLNNAAQGGKVSGAGTTSVAIRDIADSKSRVAATVDANGNRTAVTLDLT